MGGIGDGHDALALAVCISAPHPGTYSIARGGGGG